MPGEKSFELFITEERHVKCVGDPKDVFDILTGLKLCGYTPRVRVMDKESRDWTCWQPSIP